jgi:hypothetical protein
MARTFEAEITVREVGEGKDTRVRRKLHENKRKFGYVTVGGHDDSAYVRASLVTELAKLFADSVVTITVDTSIE